MEAINLVLDFVLLATSIWMITVIRKLGGKVGYAFSAIAAGSLILGLAHAIETMTFELFHWDIGIVEVVHRLIVLIGFVFIIIGFKRIEAVWKEK